MAITKLNSLAIPADTVVAADIADGSITAAKLADDAVTSAKIADDAVVAAAIADNAVVTAAIADDAVTTAKTTVTSPNPNLMMNSAMTVFQRGGLSGQSGTTSVYGGVDRWQLELRNVGTYSFSQGSTRPDGFNNSMYVQCTTADSSLDANSYGHLTYKFEGQDLAVFKKGTSGALPFALSFWTRSSKTGTYVVRMRDNTNARYISKNYTISTADTWEYKTIVIPADTTGVFSQGTASALSVYFWFSAGTDYTSGSAESAWGQAASSTLAPGQVNLSDTANAIMFWTGVKLEAASACTAYEHPDYQTELVKCQRYYYKMDTNQYLYAGDYGSFSMAVMHHPVEMRATPTVTYTTNGTNVGTYHSKQFIQVYMNANQKALLTGAADAEI